MLKMETDKSRNATTIRHISGHIAIFTSLSDALMYMGIMKDLYYNAVGRRLAGEPYPVRELNPGRYPIKIKKTRR